MNNDKDKKTDSLKNSNKKIPISGRTDQQKSDLGKKSSETPKENLGKNKKFGR